MKNRMGIAATLIIGSVLLIGFYFYISPTISTTAEEENIAAQLNEPNSITSTAAIKAKKAGAAGQSGAGKADEEFSEENYQYIEDRLNIMRERRPGVSYDPVLVAAAMARQDAWKPSPTVPSDLPLSQEDLNDGREFINFDSLKIETLVPGDTVKLAIEDTDQEYDVIIDKVEQQDETRITWTGHIDGHDGQPYHVSITKGELLSVGGIDTPDGHYVLQAHGDKGWVASSGLLFKNHADPIVPPEEELNNPPVSTPGEIHSEDAH